MTDPATPATEPEAKRRRLSKTWRIGIVAGVASLLVLGGAAYGVKAKGDSQADDYAKALDAWNDQRNDLLGAPSEANRVLWAIDEDATTKKSLVTQREACDDVVTIQKSVAKNAAAVPKEPGSFFKLLSSDERKAIKDSAARVKAVKAYAKAADTVLEQLHKDCTWNIRANSADGGESGSKKVYDEAEKLLLKPGHSSGSYYCPSSSDGSCLPGSRAEQTHYAELLLKAIKLDKEFFMKEYFTPGSCESTSYGALCKDLKANLASYYGTSEDYSAIIKTIDPTSSKVEDEFKKMEKLDKVSNKEFKAALLKAHPELKADSRVADNVFWREAFFNASAEAAIKKLDKLRQAVLDVANDSDSVDVLGQVSLRLH